MSTAAATISLSLNARKTDLGLRVTGVFGFALLTAVFAQVAIPIPGTPVPVTLQTLAVTMAAFALGGRLGAMSMGLYMLMGMAGLPVYADGNGGWAASFGATGGYLLGFILAQPVMAWAARTPEGRYAGWRGVVTALVLGHVVIFILGVGWLKLSLGVAWPAALNMGLWPFLPGSLVKGGAALFFGLLVTPWICRRGW